VSDLGLVRRKRFIRILWRFLIRFDVRHVHYGGFGIRDADDQITLPLNLCETTKLFCHPGMDYITENKWTTESTLTARRGQNCHWSMDRPEEASPAIVVIRHGSYGYKRYGNLPVVDAWTHFGLASVPPACNLPTLIRAIAGDSSRPIHFIVTPHVDRLRDKHRFCFPKLRPINQQGENLAVKFESSCSCGNGDFNHCQSQSFIPFRVNAYMSRFEAYLSACSLGWYNRGFSRYDRAVGQDLRGIGRRRGF
jgi:hypothetical protein